MSPSSLPSSFVASRRLRAIAMVCGLPLLGACSLLSHKMDPATQAQIRDEIKPGMGLSEASDRIEAHGFDCEVRSGSFFDEKGHEQKSPRFLFCIQRPGRVSFYCDNRNDVIAVLAADKVSDVHFSRGPDCGQRSTIDPSVQPVDKPN